MIINWIKVEKHWKVAFEITLPVPPTPGVAEIGLSRNDSDAFVLSAALAATIPSMCFKKSAHDEIRKELSRVNNPHT
jgi:hypothetical protein